MKSIIKKLVGLAAVFVVLLVVAVVVAFGYVDRIARIGIEKAGTYALGVPTTVRSADVAVFGGTFAMAGLEVANPDGFEGPHFLSLADGDVAVTLGSLRQDTVELPRLGLSGLDVVLDRRGGRANYDVILENLKKLESGGAPAEETGSGKRFVIRTVEIRDIVVHVNLLPEVGDLTKTDLEIDEIVLTDVGSEGDRGVLLAELSNILVKAILAAIVERGGNIIPGDVLAGLQGGLAQLDSLSDLGVGMVDEASRRVEGAKGEIDEKVGEVKGEIEDLGREAENAIKGLGGLLGGEKKDK